MPDQLTDTPGTVAVGAVLTAARALTSWHGAAAVEPCVRTLADNITTWLLPDRHAELAARLALALAEEQDEHLRTGEEYERYRSEAREHTRCCDAERAYLRNTITAGEATAAELLRQAEEATAARLAAEAEAAELRDELESTRQELGKIRNHRGSAQQDLSTQPAHTA